jgi:hypothetical protein
MKKLSCSEATRLLSVRQDRGLRFGERLSLRLHLTICDGCTAVGRQLEFLRRALRHRAEHMEQEAD